jgi:hypothetical protein
MLLRSGVESSQHQIIHLVTPGGLPRGLPQRQAHHRAGRMKTSPPRCLGQQREPFLQRPEVLTVLVGQGPTAGGDLEESLVVPGEF